MSLHLVKGGDPSSGAVARRELVRLGKSLVFGAGYLSRYLLHWMVAGAGFVLGMMTGSALYEWWFG